MSKVTVTLSMHTAQRLYDHTGTMPYARGSWSDEVRRALNQELAPAWSAGYLGGSMKQGPDGEEYQ